MTRVGILMSLRLSHIWPALEQDPRLVFWSLTKHLSYSIPCFLASDSRRPGKICFAYVLYRWRVFFWLRTLYHHRNIFLRWSSVYCLPWPARCIQVYGTPCRSISLSASTNCLWASWYFSNCLAIRHAFFLTKFCIWDCDISLGATACMFLPSTTLRRRYLTGLRMMCKLYFIAWLYRRYNTKIDEFGHTARSMRPITKSGKSLAKCQ